MEDTLDLIAKGNKIWHELCQECLDQVELLSTEIGEDIKREQIRIDSDHTYMIAKYGPVIKCGNDENPTFKKVRNDIDMDKLRRGEYKLEDLVQVDRVLGKYENYDVYLKRGKFGPYVEWNENRRSIKMIEGKKYEDLELCDVMEFITAEKPNSSIIRIINDEISIRVGKYGDYIFYKKTGWKKPRFLKLQGFIKKHGQNSYKECEIDLIMNWLNDEYKI